ncbi:metal-dependent transcriptional regulator [Winogradskyella aquimaris]|uniref:Transcriptional regulator MntR n=1 Tax=Winogradskyella aquimaris TaxID=864074 RepID=A0ABU5EKX9_9FLAO|nr:metal-dependent transcriptional regulator [Winogradskyella aquimaris]MDY2586395.1 metal-dependent transcriptional regulator [Winogradskyella aquimaris]
MITLSEENYLKAIYHLETGEGRAVSTNAIAEKIESKASSVTDMVKKLADKDFVNYKKYQGVSLTKKGRHTAINIIRKHRLWEVFLVDKLNFSWDEVHDVAEQLEHIKSPKLIDELDAFLEFPTHDPHGDPIPDKNGVISKSDKIKLSKAETNTYCKFVGVNDSSSDFLKYLDKHHIALGCEIKVLGKESFDESMTILIEDKTLNISKTVSNNLFVKTI